MSERTEVEVSFPVVRQPDGLETRMIVRQAFREAAELVAPGRVLGLIGFRNGKDPRNGDPALLVRFAVEAPEAIQSRRKVHATH